MKIITHLFNGLIIVLIGFGSSLSLKAQSAPTASQTFSFTGTVQQFTVPPCVGSMTIEALAASGGPGTSGGPLGANGGLVRGVMTATPGQVLYIYVGGQSTAVAGGFNGGGDGGVSSTSSGGGGGGGTDVRLGGTALSNRIIVAGGGGGGGGNTTYGAGPGIGGGGTSCSNPLGVGGGAATGFGTGNTAGGCTGGTAPNYASGGAGAGLTSGGGGGGQPSSTTGGYGCNGALGIGGAGGGTTNYTLCGGATGGVNGGGGGGGGYYGGGGGMTGTGGGNGGGGGGSSFAQTPMFSNVTFSPGNLTSTGNGSVALIYAFNGSLTNATVTPFAICSGQTATITAGGSTTYTWSNSSNATSITANPTSNTSYTVTGTNSIGCISSAIITVTVTSGVPVLSVNTSTNQICLGKTVTLTASGALTYTWSNSVSNGQSYSPSVTTTYTVQGQNGCGTTSAVTIVSVSPLPVTAIANPTSSCAGNNTTLTAISAGTSYTWQPFGLLGASVVVSPTSTTIFTVAATDGTCSGVGTVTVLANPNPTLVATISSASMCAGGTVTLTAIGANSYTWSVAGTAIGTGSMITAVPTGATQYSVAGNNAIGCLGGTSQVVLVYASPTLVVSTSDPVICNGGSATLTVSGADTYTWTGGSNNSSLIVNPIQTTAYNIAGTYTGGVSCTSSTVISVAVFSPSVSITGGTAVCVGESATLSASAAGAWLWSNSATNQYITVIPVATTVYSVMALTASANINCPSSSSIQVTVYPNPTITVTTLRSNMCKGESNVCSVTGANTYTWDTGATTTSITITSSLVTTLLYTVTGNSIDGCKATASVQVKVNPCVGINKEELNDKFLSIYPNPNNGNFIIKAQADMHLNVMNELGQIIKSVILNVGNRYLSEVNELPVGIYFLVSTGNNASLNYKIIVTK